jgi:hypothetical protein
MSSPEEVVAQKRVIPKKRVLILVHHKEKDGWTSQQRFSNTGFPQNLMA